MDDVRIYHSSRAKLTTGQVHPVKYLRKQIRRSLFHRAGRALSAGGGATALQAGGGQIQITHAKMPRGV